MLTRFLIVIFSIFYFHSLALDKVSISPAPSWLYKVNPDLHKKPAANQFVDDLLRCIANSLEFLLRVSQG